MWESAVVWEAKQVDLGAPIEAERQTGSRDLVGAAMCVAPASAVPRAGVEILVVVGASGGAAGAAASAVGAAASGGAAVAAGVAAAAVAAAVAAADVDETG